MPLTYSGSPTELGAQLLEESVDDGDLTLQALVRSYRLEDVGQARVLAAGSRNAPGSIHDNVSAAGGAAWVA